MSVSACLQVYVIVPAAGRGTRLGGTPKQFRLLGGEPVLIHTLRALSGCPEVDGIVVAVTKDAKAHRFYPALRVAAVTGGGATRRESVAQAMRAVPLTADIVLVHDAVRPFVLEAHVSAVIAKTRQVGAAALAVPVSDTMRYGQSGRFGRTICRDDLYHVQTPQGFRRSILAEALALPDTGATDEARLVQELGYPVAIVPGSRTNMKITTEDDWALANQYAAMQDICV